MRNRTACELRAAFAQQMAATYGREVPAYNTLVDVALDMDMVRMVKTPEEIRRLRKATEITVYPA